MKQQTKQDSQKGKASIMSLTADAGRYNRRRKLFIRVLIAVLVVGLIGALCLAYYIRKNLQCTYKESFYISEEVELAPDDPGGINPYK